MSLLRCLKSRRPRSSRRPRRPARWVLPVVLVVLVALAASALIFSDSFPFISSAQSQANLSNLYNRAQARLAVGDYAAAIETFEELLALAPNDAEAQAGLERARRYATQDSCSGTRGSQSSRKSG